MQNPSCATINTRRIIYVGCLDYARLCSDCNNVGRVGLLEGTHVSVDASNGMGMADETVSGAAVGRREQKKHKTRVNLHLAALSLVNANGLDSVTTDQIAARAGVSPRTFFNYFPTKEQAILGFPADFPDRLVEAFLARPESEEPWQSVVFLIKRMAQGGMANHEGPSDVGRDVLSKYPHLIRGLVDMSEDIRTELGAAIAGRLEAQGYEAAEAQIRADTYVGQGFAIVTTALRVARSQDVSLETAFGEVNRVLASMQV